MRADNCLFCSIVSGETPAAIVYEDENTLVFWITGRFLRVIVW
jgi:hypothetical protein